MEEKRISPLKAIRLKCLDCCCGSVHEIKLCTAEQCPLYPFRLGKNPNRAGIGGNVHPEPKNPNSTNDSATNSSPEGVYIPKIKTAENARYSKEESNNAQCSNSP